jgi:tetratricopeptide (TPR) repeat protein
MIECRRVAFLAVCVACSTQCFAQGSAPPTGQRLTLLHNSVASLKPDDPALPGLLDELAELEYRAGRLSDAERSASRALTIRKGAMGPDHPSVATSMNNLGEVLFAEGRYKDAEQYYRGAVELVHRETPPDPKRQAKFLANLGKALTARGRDAEAGQALTRALSIWTRTGNSSEEAATLGMIGMLMRKRGEYAESEEMFRRALDRLPPDHPNALTARIHLADVLRLRRRYDESERLFNQTLPLLEDRLGREHPDRAAALTLYASLLRDTRRMAEAKPLLVEARRIREEHSRTNGTAWVVDARVRR